MELEEILVQHCRKYPNLQIIDIIKLIYQNEFGCGHLLKNESEGLEQLTDEWNSINSSPEDIYDNIGNGLCRLNLPAAKAENLSVSTLSRFFVNTANTHTGSLFGLESKLSLLSRLYADKVLPFDGNELKQVLALYKKSGYAAVNHSSIYHQYYAPSYRVVKKMYCDFFPLFCKIETLLRAKLNLLLAIDGNAGAGKSTLANLIAKTYNCNIVHMDHFFLPQNKRSTKRLCEIGGNVDYEHFYDEVISRIFQGSEFTYRVFDCGKMNFADSVNVNPKIMTVIEGSYSLHPYFGDVYDLKAFLTADYETQKIRILNRSGAEMLEKFVALWIPKENEYFHKLRISEKCDYVF
ncbi:MAG: hypothetical protein CVU87_02175 [Firmicutes bacterium HGW-Firmicutes-12]|jgi:uridine kinase|nr:MAG: hypothetical protein CVU87_02175 [Firmicutes bacterium HGW-Firmicutes-12]